jgi:predicted protein tyrosine phosphatase
VIIVCPLSQVQPLVLEHDVSHVVSLLGPDTPHRTFDGVTPHRHLKLTFHDIVEPAEGLTPPSEVDAERLIDFIAAWNLEQPMLIHCWAGISRSTAAAYAALCMLEPDASEQDLAWRLRDASPSATPNRLIVSFTDQMLGRGGRMKAAVDKIGRAVHSEYSPLNRRRSS